MKYKVHLTALFYGESVVDAPNKTAAERIVPNENITWVDHEITDVCAVPAPTEENDRTYIVSEWCQNCNTDIEMVWDTDRDGFEAFCPHCGAKLMLCDECRHMDPPQPCDYDSVFDTCHMRKQ